MSVKVASIGYISKSRGNADVFLANLARHAPSHELITFSDTHPGASLRLPHANVEDVRDVLAANGKPNRFAVANRVWFTALRIAIKSQITHFLWLESDCRVNGAGWDAKLFGEYFDNPKPIVCAGSPVCYNAANSGIDCLRRFYALADECCAGGYALPPFGSRGAGDPGGTSLFVNGAGAIYDVAAMQMLFPTILEDGQTFRLAVDCMPFDMEVGIRLFAKFGPSVFDLVGFLPSEYSGYGDATFSEDQRLDMLRTGRVRLVHQTKSTATV